MATIYSLNDPITLDPFYIGATNRPLDKRLKSHISAAMRVGNSESYHAGRKEKVRSIIRGGTSPLICKIDEVAMPLACGKEKEFYMKFIKAGYILLQSPHRFTYTKNGYLSKCKK